MDNPQTVLSILFEIHEQWEGERSEQTYTYEKKSEP